MSTFSKITIFIVCMWLMLLATWINPFFQGWYADFVSFIYAFFLFGVGGGGLLFLFIWIMLSFPSGHTFKINFGEHRSIFRFAPFVGKYSAIFRVLFHKGFDYNGSKQLKTQENKIAGVNWGFPRFDFKKRKWVHKNSLRVTFRGPIYNGSKDFVLSYYGYYKGIRFTRTYSYFNSDHVPNVEFQISNELMIALIKQSGKFTCDEKENIKLPKFGYHLFPYFGGELPYPDDQLSMTIYKRDYFQKLHWLSEFEDFKKELKHF